MSRPDPDPTAAFQAERVRLLRRRTLVASGCVVGASLVYLPLHGFHHPENSGLLTLFLALGSLVCLAGAAVCQHPRLGDRIAAVASVCMVVIVGLADVYATLVGQRVEQVALSHVTMLAFGLVLLPWGWRPQLFASAATTLSLVLAAPHLPNVEGEMGLRLHPLFALAAAAGAAVAGTFLLDRYRFEAFQRVQQHAEEAEIAAALTRVGSVLHAHVRAPDMLERALRETAAALGCDWGATVSWDDARRTFVPGALAGFDAPPASPELDALADALLPLQRRCRPGETIEIAGPSAGDLVPRRVLELLDVSSALLVPIFADEKLVGMMAYGHRRRAGGFSRRQHRLALGIADVTAVAIENARLLRQTEAASNLKSQFVAAMSHELRTPLNVISGYTDLLEEGAFGPLTAPQMDTLQRIKRGAFELLELVNATLDIGRLEAGRETVVHEPVDVERLFEELAREAELVVVPGVALAWTVTPPGLVVGSDGTKLKTILKNLVGNALKFTARGRVDVSACLRDGALALTVTDTGIGIASEQLPVIFEMFRQGDGSSTRRFGGVGLGLHIVQRLSELLGGTVSVESAVGRGSAFTVIVPAADVPTAAAVGA